MKNIKKLTISLFLSLMVVLSLSAFSLHKFYVGVTEVNYNSEAKTLEIAVKLFTDDLEQALEESGETGRLFLGEKNENPKTEAAILAYLYRNFTVEVNGKPTDWEFIGKEADIDACWSYLQVNNVRKVKKLKVRNTSLIEILPKQTHMVNVHVNGEKRSKLFSASKIEEEFLF